MKQSRGESHAASGLGLRAKVMRGGTFMAGRQALGMVVSLVGVILVTRQIGPTQYGLFAACIGVFNYFVYVGGWGIDIYLMRRPEGQAPRELFDQAFTLLFVIALVGMGVGMALLGVLQEWVGLEGFAPMIAVFFAGLPLALVQLSPRAQLERRLDYHRIAVIELVTVCQFQGTALALAYLGFNAWSLIIAWVVDQVLSLAMFLLASGYRPRLAWSWKPVKDMLQFGLGFTASTFAIQLRNLINPLIVAPFAGAAAAGYVGMAIQFVFRLSIIKQLSAQMSVAALAKVQHDRDRVRALLSEGMQLHVLCVGVPLVAFALVGPWLIPWLMGEDWRSVARLVPLISVGFLVNAVFSLHSSVLQLYRRNWDVAVFNAVLMGVLFVGSAILVPRVGWIGYGWAEVIALPAYFLIHHFLRRQVGSPDYLVPLVWSLGLGLLLLYPWLGMPALVAAGFILLWPLTWRQILSHASQVRQAVVLKE